VNILTDKNRRLYTKLETAKSEAMKFEKLYLQTTIPKRKLKKPRRQLENALTIKLRNQLKEVRAELKDVKSLKEKLLRKTKFT